MKSLFIRLLDLVSSKLDKAAKEALEEVARKRQPQIIYRETVILVPTPDRPSDPFLEKVRQEARALTGEAEAVRYPEGS